MVNSSAVYVTGIHIYETFHPGAVVKVEGFDDWPRPVDPLEDEGLLWEGPNDVPDGSGVYDPESGQISTVSRVYKCVPFNC